MCDTMRSLFREPLNNPVAACASWFWAVCGVANPRHSPGYGCGLRLAAHPKPKRAGSLRVIQRFPCFPRARSAGFTLIELMVVVLVISILAMLGYPSYTDYLVRGRLAEARATLLEGRVRMEQYFQDNKTYVDGPCPANSQWFVYTCARPASTYTITATGRPGTNADGFIFSITERNVRITNSAPEHWGTTSMNNCWITKRGVCE